MRTSASSIPAESTCRISNPSLRAEYDRRRREKRQRLAHSASDLAFLLVTDRAVPPAELRERFDAADLAALECYIGELRGVIDGAADLESRTRSLLGFGS